MANAFHGGLMAAVMMTGVVGCADAPEPDDEAPVYVAAGELIETDDRLYVLEVTPAERWEWPTYAGEARLTMRIAAGPEFVTKDPGDDQTDAIGPEFPLRLIVLALTPPKSADKVSYPEAWPTDRDGTEWTIDVDFSAPGDWILPIQISDEGGRTDTASLGFKIRPAWNKAAPADR